MDLKEAEMIIIPKITVNINTDKWGVFYLGKIKRDLYFNQKTKSWGISELPVNIIL